MERNPLVQLGARSHRFRSFRFVAAAVALAHLAAAPAAAVPLLISGHGTRPVDGTDVFHYGGEEKRARTLDGLFAALKRPDSERFARSIIEQIWLNWQQSGRRDVDDLLSRAKINASEGEFGAALEKLDRLHLLAPTFAEGWNGRATILFHMNRYSEALSAIDETLQYEPRHFGALAGRGMILFQQGDLAAALQAYEEALRHNPYIAERETIVPLIRHKLGMLKL